MKKILFFRKKPDFFDTLRDTVPFDPERQVAVIRASICTGEKVAGFRDKASGRFREATVIRSEEDRKRFMEVYGLTELNTEY